MLNKRLVQIKHISDTLFGLIIIYALGIMAKTYFDQSKLPEGVCPISNNSTYMVIAIVLLIGAFIMTTFIDFKYKKAIKENKIDTKSKEDTKEDTKE